MRWLLQFLFVFSLLVSGRALAEPAGVDPSEGRWSVEMSIWTSHGAPTITATLMGERVSKDMRAQGGGVYSTTFQVPFGRIIPVQFELSDGSIHQDLVVLQHEDHQVHWFATKDGEVQRASAPASRDRLALQEAVILTAGALWILLSGVVLISGRLERENQAEVSWRLPDHLWLLFWLLLSVLFTWPAVLSSDTMVVGRHFDAPGTVWFIGSGFRMLGSIDPMSSWPLGADLSRLDSFLLVPISGLLSFLGAGRLFGWLALAGVALNAWSAQHFARAVGVRSPWTLLAGFGYGFCGMAATGLLEGHVYQVLNPWLPWFGMFLWRATDTDGIAKDAWMSTMMFILCWLTSAYVGIAALGLALAILASSKRRPRAVVAPCLAFLVAYFVWYMRGDGLLRETLETLNPMSAHLAGLLAATPEIDRTEHSMAPIVFGWMLGLVLLSTKVLPKGRWRVFLWVIGASALFSMMPRFAASSDLVLFPANLEWVRGGLAGMLRFPVRWAWLWSLCGGLVAAKAASALAPRWGRMGWLILAIVVAESFVRVGTPYRQETRYIEAPQTIAERPGAVLELFPISEGYGDNHDGWLSAFSCIEQLTHQQPIAEECLQTRPRQIRHHLNLWLQDRLMRAQVGGVGETLAGLGFRTVTIHPDLFVPEDAATMLTQLRSLDARPVLVREKGVHAWLFAMEGSPSSDPAAAYQQLTLSQQPEVSRREWVRGVHHGKFNGWVSVVSWLIIAFGLGIALKRR